MGGFGALVTSTNIPVNPGDIINIVVGGIGVWNVTAAQTLVIAGAGGGGGGSPAGMAGGGEGGGGGGNVIGNSGGGGSVFA